MNNNDTVFLTFHHWDPFILAGPVAVDQATKAMLKKEVDAYNDHIRRLEQGVAPAKSYESEAEREAYYDVTFGQGDVYNGAFNPFSHIISFSLVSQQDEPELFENMDQYATKLIPLQVTDLFNEPYTNEGDFYLGYGTLPTTKKLLNK